MKKFSSYITNEDNPLWSICIARKQTLSQRQEEMRSEFWRDYNRILHSKAYRRLKHKTQVFHATGNDHVCTRMEHVQHVGAISYSIAKELGLNTELVQAISIGHDIGHAPFGHDGEQILNQLAQKYYQGSFWHEKNGLLLADNIETLQNENGENENLNLTYAVRDGIISHCGEVDFNSLQLRKEPIDLDTIDKPNQYPPFTWEACIVKIADKIAYLGRDLEDAQRLSILQKEHINELQHIQSQYFGKTLKSSTNTALIHSFCVDLCKNSSPDIGIRFSDNCFQTIKEIKEFNYKYIYKHTRLQYFKAYSQLVINSIFEVLLSLQNEGNIAQQIENKIRLFPKLISSFEKWLIYHTNYQDNNKNIVFLIDNQYDYIRTIISFIASMSDYFAMESFRELTAFE